MRTIFGYTEEPRRLDDILEIKLGCLKQTIFKHFITSPPLDVNIEELDELREFKRRNVVRLMNILTQESLENKWNPDANDSLHHVNLRVNNETHVFVKNEQYKTFKSKNKGKIC